MYDLIICFNSIILAAGLVIRGAVWWGGGRVKQGKKSGNNSNNLGEKLMVAWNRVVAVEVVRSGQILDIVCKKSSSFYKR